MKELLRCCVASLLLWAAVANGQAQDQPKYTLRYAPEIGQKHAGKFTGLLLDIAFQGQSMGVEGDVSADLESEIIERDEKTQATTVKLLLTRVRANLNGQISAPDDPPPGQLVIGPLGNLVGSKENKADDTINLMDTGGIPISMVAILATTLRFADAAVAVDEDWEFEDIYQVPGLGETPLSVRSKLTSIENDTALVTSTATMALPDFKTANPMMPGTTMDVKSARAYITDLKQAYDISSSQMIKSEGKLRLDAQLDMMGMTVPVSLAMSFSVMPPEKPQATDE